MPQVTPVGRLWHVTCCRLRFKHRRQKSGRTDVMHTHFCTGATGYPIDRACTRTFKPCPDWQNGCTLQSCTHSAKRPGKNKGTNPSKQAHQHTSSKHTLIALARSATARIRADMPAGTLQPSAYCTCLARHACSHPGVLRARILPPLLQLPITSSACAQQPAIAGCWPPPKIV